MPTRTRLLAARLAAVSALLLSPISCTVTTPAADGTAASEGAVDAGPGGDGQDVDGEPPRDPAHLDSEPDVPPLSDEVDELDEVVVRVRGAEGEVRIDAKVAAADRDRRRGLMHVPALPDGAGMLFVFPRERTGGFWMKDTLVPLDVAFADDDGEVVEILSMGLCTSDPCPVHDPAVAYRYALEVPQGWFDANGVREGDELVIGEVVPPGRAGSDRQTAGQREP